jgi:hypothetical protein
MKRILYLPFIGLISIFLFAFSGNEKKSDVKLSLLKGKVKEVTEYTYYTKRFNAADTVSNNGSTLRIKSDSIKERLITRFNEQGNEIEESDTTINEHPRHGKPKFEQFFWSHLISIYDSTGRKVRSVYNWVADERRDSLQTTFLYDKAGNNILEYDTSLLFGNSKGVKIFNDRGLETKVIYTHSNNNKRALVSKYKYDTKDNLIVYKEHNYDGRTRFKSRDKYDARNNRIEVKGRRHLKQLGPSNWLWWYSYDVNGRIIGEEEMSYYKKSKPIHNKYFYKYQNSDSQGNWLRKIQVSDDTLMTVTEREIEYYR